MTSPMKLPTIPKKGMTMPVMRLPRSHDMPVATAGRYKPVIPVKSENGMGKIWMAVSVRAAEMTGRKR